MSQTPADASSRVEDVLPLASLDDSVVQEALQSGLDLRRYSREVEEKLKAVEHDAIQDYINEAENVAQLHNQIAACDEILQRMEDMLSCCQSDLGSISSEIQTLQQQSIVMNLKLKNRQAVRGELSQLVDEMVVSEAMIRHISEASVSEREFLEQLHELQHKITFVKEQSFREAKACDDVIEILEKLKIKALSKIREFLLQKIYQFRKPLANYQIPQNTLLKHRFYYEFLLANERQLAKEIRDEYVETVSKMYYSYFKTYAGRLLKLQFDDVAKKDDLLGISDAAKASNMGLFASRPQMRSRATVFTLGNRGAVIGADLEAPIIVPHTGGQPTAATPQKFPLEALFRSMQFALLDSFSREFLFLGDFFVVVANGANDLFWQVTGKATSVLLKATETAIAESYDSIALTLCVHVCFRYRAISQKRGVQVLDSYWDQLLGCLWPRLEHVIQLNVDSITDADASKVGNVDVQPHYIVRRYAEYASALVSIHQSYPDERMLSSLSRLQSAIERFIARLSNEFGDRRRRLIFLINNYDLLLSVLSEKTADNSAEAESFRELLNVRSSEYVYEVLFPHFGEMMNFVRECEPLIEQNQTEILRRYVEKVPHVVKTFNTDWKKNLDKINHDVMGSFANLKNGSNILQAALTQFLTHFQKFTKVLQHTAFANCTARNELINFHPVMVEVKKHKPVFS